MTNGLGKGGLRDISDNRKEASLKQQVLDCNESPGPAEQMGGSGSGVLAASRKREATHLGVTAAAEADCHRDKESNARPLGLGRHSQ